MILYLGDFVNNIVIFVEKGGKKMEREQTTIRLPVELKEQLQQEAERRGDSFNSTIIKFILLGLKHE